MCIHTNKERDILFDNIKVFLLFCVVLGHTLDIYTYPFLSVKFIYSFIYFFHMPAFIFVSGYFSKNSKKGRETAFADFFIPYLILTILSFLQIKYTLPAPKNNITLRLFSPPSGCWYLFFIFIMKLFLVDLIKIRYIVFLLPIFGLLSGFSEEFSLKMGLGRFAVFSFYFIAGYFTNKKHIQKMKRIPVIVPLISILITALFSYYYVFSNKWPISLLYNRTFYRQGLEFNDFTLRMIYYFLSILMIIAIIKFTPSKRMCYTNIGKYSITVYIFHLFITRYTDFKLKNMKLFFNLNEYIYIIITLIISTVIVYLCSRPAIYNFYLYIISKIKCIFIKKNVF